MPNRELYPVQLVPGSVKLLGKRDWFAKSVSQADGGGTLLQLPIRFHPTNDLPLRLRRKQDENALAGTG